MERGLALVYGSGRRADSGTGDDVVPNGAEAPGYYTVNASIVQQRNFAGWHGAAARRFSWYFAAFLRLVVRGGSTGSDVVLQNRLPEQLHRGAASMTVAEQADFQVNLPGRIAGDVQPSGGKIGRDQAARQPSDAAAVQA